MELRHLRYFIGVAEDLNFSRAAGRLHVAQSALSRPIQDLEGDIQSGFIGMPFAELQARLCFKVFRRDRMVVALPAGHPLAPRKSVPLAELAVERFIFLTRAGTPVYYDWLTRLCHHAGFHPNIAQEVEIGQTTVELLGAGSGVALFPGTAQRQLHGDMSFHPLAGNVSRFDYAVAWRRDDASPALATFLSLLRAEVNTRAPKKPGTACSTRNQHEWTRSPPGRARFSSPSLSSTAPRRPKRCGAISEPPLSPAASLAARAICSSSRCWT